MPTTTRLHRLKLRFLKPLFCMRRQSVQEAEPAAGRPHPAPALPTTRGTGATNTPTTNESASSGQGLGLNTDQSAGILGSGKKQKQVEKTGLHEQDPEQEPEPEPEPLEACPICHDLVGAPNPEGVTESWVQLHCGHKFGSTCIQCWVDESAKIHPLLEPTCPICRTTAKHVCGHPIVTPLRGFLYLGYQQRPIYIEPERRRPRRRLTRRSGHPHGPPPAPPHSTNPRVQIVGKCHYCAAIEAQEEMRRKRLGAVRPGTDDDGTESGPSAGSSRRPGTKTVMLQTNFRRLSISSSSDPLSEGMPSRYPSVLAYHLDHLEMCRRQHRSSLLAERSPTPANLDRIEVP